MLPVPPWQRVGSLSQGDFALYRVVYEGGLTQGRVVGIVSQLYNIWFIVGLLMCVAGVVWIVVVTRRNYKPIEAIVSRIHNYSQSKTSALIHNSKQDEFAFIESALESMLEQAATFNSDIGRISAQSVSVPALMEGQYPSHMEQWNERGRHGTAGLVRITDRQCHRNR